MEQRRVTPLTTAGCFAAIMLVFALLSTYVPIFSFIGYFIMPIPMVIIFMKYGLRQTLLLGVTVGFLMGLFIDPVTALVQFLSFGAVGLALGAGFRYEWSAVRLLGTVTAALVAVFVVIALLSYVVLDVNVFTQMNDFFTQFMDSMMAQYQQQGNKPANTRPAELVPEQAAQRACQTRTQVITEQIQRGGLTLGAAGAGADPAAGHRVGGKETGGK